MAQIGVHRHSRRCDLVKRIKKYRTLLLMLIPGLLLVFVFNYIPMVGLGLAFVDIRLNNIRSIPFVGLKYFEKILVDHSFMLALKNSLIISIMKTVCGFPVPILFAICLNEMRSLRYKKIVQTVSYLPHFISWVIMASIFKQIFSLNGPINAIVSAFGGEPVYFMTDSHYFRWILVITDIWKGFGWSSIIYFAALCGINPELYEAAELDGANRRQKAWFISIPSIAPTIVVLLVLNLRGILSAGFDQIFNMYSVSVYDVADIIDTYVYRKGIQNAEFSYSTAIGLFNSFVAFVLMVIVNKLANLVSHGEMGLW